MSHIDYTREENPIARFEIDGRGYHFSVSCVPKENHVWLVETIDSYMREIHQRATDKAVKNLQQEFKCLLNISHNNR